MKAKVKIGKLISTVDKGMVALTTVEDAEAQHSDFGRFAIVSGKIGIKAITNKAASYCTSQLADDEEAESGGCHAISLPKLRSILASLPKNDFVEFEYKAGEGEDSTGNLFFISNKTNWKMPCMPPTVVSDVNIDDGDFCFEIEKEKFLEAASSISFASNLNDAFFTTCNVCVSVDDKYVLLGATDDIRCATIRLESPNLIKGKRFLLPIPSLTKALKCFDNGLIKVYSGVGFARFSQEGHSVRMSLPGGADIRRFPNFEAVSKKDQPFKLRVMTSKFKSMVGTCADMNREEFLMKIDQDFINVYSYGASDSISYHSAMAYSGDKVSVSIGVCSMFLMDFMKKVKEEVIQIEFAEKEGKPKYMIIQDCAGMFYLMKALVDLVHVPIESKEK